MLMMDVAIMMAVLLTCVFAGKYFRICSSMSLHSPAASCDIRSGYNASSRSVSQAGQCLQAHACESDHSIKLERTGHVYSSCVGKDIDANCTALHAAPEQSKDKTHFQQKNHRLRTEFLTISHIHALGVQELALVISCNKSIHILSILRTDSLYTRMCNN